MTHDFDYSEYKEEPDDDAMAALLRLVSEQAAAELLVVELEGKLKKAMVTLDDLSTRDIPDLMGDMCIRDITLESGLTVKLEKKLYLSLPKKERERYANGLVWLEANGYGKSVKNKLVAEFAKGRQEEAKKLAERLRKENYAVETVEEIHPSTLKSVLTTWVDEGNEDEEAEKLFALRRVDVAKIK